MKKRMMLLGILLTGGMMLLPAGGGYIEERAVSAEAGLTAGVVHTSTEWMAKNDRAAVRSMDASFGGKGTEHVIQAGQTPEQPQEKEALVEEETQEAMVEEHERLLVASEYVDIAIAQVNNYVNVRALPSTDSEVLGKLYHQSAATVLETTADGWYRILSGTVEGYVKAEYVVVGDEELARSVGTRYATVTTTTLFVRSEPTTEARVLTMLPEGDDLVVLDESAEGWVKVATVEGDGYVSADYVQLSTEYVHAESKAEEEARLAREEAERQAAARAAQAARKAQEAEQAAERARQQAAAKAAQQGSHGGKGSEQSGGTGGGQSGSVGSSVSNGQAVVDYGMQFLGNPYVFGGTSLTGGADCSGFVQSVYAAFGVKLPRNSTAQRSAGYAVSLAEIQPGDLVCYSGHIGIYAGNNTLLHASNERTGITLTSPVTYRQVIAVRRIF